MYPLRVRAKDPRVCPTLEAAMTVRLNIPVDHQTWCRLRDVAEERKQPGARPSVAQVVREILAAALVKRDSQ